MPSTTPSKPTTKTRIAQISYLNSAPFFRNWPLSAQTELVPCVPRRLAQLAASGEVLAGPLPVIEYFRMEDAFERLGRFGIAVRGRAMSALLFSRIPIRQLDRAKISVTEETSTTFLLLRLLLEQRFHLESPAYSRGETKDADAVLLIGDEAIRVQQENKQYPFEYDLAFEWWLWQHLPFVFAVWAIRKGQDAGLKRQLELGITQALGENGRQLAEIGKERGPDVGLSAEAAEEYLERFIYRLSPGEEEGLSKFRDLLHAYDLL